MLSLVPQREASILVERAPWADRFQMHVQNTATEAMPVGAPSLQLSHLLPLHGHFTHAGRGREVSMTITLCF